MIVIFHAGIGQDFSLPFLDPTPEDIPSTYIDNNMVIIPDINLLIISSSLPYLIDKIIDDNKVIDQNKLFFIKLLINNVFLLKKNL